MFGLGYQWPILKWEGIQIHGTTEQMDVPHKFDISSYLILHMYPLTVHGQDEEVWRKKHKETFLGSLQKSKQLLEKCLQMDASALV